MSGAENEVGLREFYSFTIDENNKPIGDEVGRLIQTGSRSSLHNNLMGGHIKTVSVGPFGYLISTPYKY